MSGLPEGYRVRPYTPDDSGAVAEFFNRVEQEPESADSLRSRFEKYPSTMAVQRLIVEHAGMPVAYGHSVALHEAGGTQPLVFIIRADVVPAHEGRGIGRHLFSLNESFAREKGAAWLMSKVRDDLERGRRFLEQLGYRQEQHLYGVILDLEGWDQPLVLPEGIEIKSWADYPDDAANRRKLYECTIAADADTPGIELWGLVEYDDWDKYTFESRWFRPEGCLIAVDERGDWIGVSVAGPTDEENVSTDFTGVVRSHRGQGIARALKVKGAQWAKSIGAKRIHTYNDDRNGAMRHINFDLGFQPQTGWRMMRKDP